MKVNRFGVSQKLFTDAIIHLIDVRWHQAGAMLFLKEWTKAQEFLDEADLIITKTFTGKASFKLEESKRNIAELRERLTRERSVPA